MSIDELRTRIAELDSQTAAVERVARIAATTRPLGFVHVPADAAEVLRLDAGDRMTRPEARLRASGTLRKLARERQRYAHKLHRLEYPDSYL